MAASVRADTVRTLYKRLHQRIRMLPEDRVAGALDELRQSFRTNAHVVDPPTLLTLVQRASSKLAYLKMITPTPRAELGRNAGSFVFRDGELQQGRGQKEAGAKHSAYDATNLDPESVSRHRQLIDRQHFGGRRF
jgi:hypothetical protein